MPKPYSVDLREKAIALVDSNKSIGEVASLLKLARNTVKSWIVLRERTGSLEPAHGYQKGHSHKIKDLDGFKEFVKQHDGDTLEEMAKKLGNVSDTTVGRMMKKVQFSRKKRPMAIKKEMKKSDSNF